VHVNISPLIPKLLHIPASPLVTDLAVDLPSGLDVETSSAIELTVREPADGDLSFHALMEVYMHGCSYLAAL
jgi:NAD(P)H-hydrate repair Nnr-like enzyme with NAD(P)H-hydrate epimerase domain